MGSMTHRVLKPHRSKMSTIYMYVIMNIYIYIYFTIPSLTFFFLVRIFTTLWDLSIPSQKLILQKSHQCNVDVY